MALAGGADAPVSRRWRAYHETLVGAAGDRVTLSADESHHVRRVLRLRPGDPLRLLDGAGSVRDGTIVETGGSAVVVELGEPVVEDAEPPVEVRLYQGLCRPDRMEWVVQKATELGVAAIHPLVCERAERVKLSGQRLERWRRIALEACKQSGRSRLPRLDPVETLPAPAAGVSPLLLDPRENATPLATALAGAGAAPVWLAVGPESGFGERESREWLERGWRAASLGPRVLRTETAGIVAVALALHLRGDLGSATV